MDLPDVITSQWPVAALFAIFSVVQTGIFIRYMEVRNGKYIKAIDALLTRMDAGFNDTKIKIDSISRGKRGL
uniref:Uncharacterized protein n=1 Tax=viral metagenome TaxID=1070528 RepID=A0A6M3L974_9ZZZZ